MFKSRPSGGMLGSVGAKIAHASTITALGNPDLRTLQDLITAEKGVLFSVQRLAADVGKSAEALKTWGQGEGDDLGDVLTHSNNLLSQFSAALTQFASYEEQVRSQLKSIRTREEGLDEMKRRKRTVDHKADAADKKLAKMGPEHKGRQAQVELLNDLKEEGRRLDIDIMNEEAAIGDYKRRTTREFLALKYAAMVELAEKTTIIGDLGKLMIEEIPLHTTPPGHPRALYSGREKTSELSSEAMRCLSEIRLNLPTMPESAPATATFEPYRHTNDSSAPMSASEYYQGTHGSAAPGSQGFYNEFGESHRPAGSSGFSAGSLRIGEDGSRAGNTGGSQFHTLPASGGGFQDRLAPITLRDDGPQETFSSSVADALSRDPAFSNPQSAPTPPPHQPTAPVGTYAPPLGPPPGALQPTLSHSYFTGILPDPTQPSSPLVPPHAFSATSPWDSAPSSPNLSRPLPDRPQSQVEETRTDLAYARDPSPVPPSPQPPVNRELPLEPPQLPPSHNLTEHQPASPPPTQAQARISHDLPNPYADALDDYYTTPTPAPPLMRAQTPPRGPEQEEYVAAREVNREAEPTPMTLYSPPPRHESMEPSSPTLAPTSSYGPTPGSTYAPPSGAPYGPPLGSPHPPAPIQDSTPTPNQGSTYGTPSEHPNPFASPLPRPPTLPPLSSVPAISSPPPMSPGGRTISAGAFRRNVSRSDTLDPGMSVPPPVSPLSVRKKTLGEDTSRGPSPAPISPGAPPMYSAIDNVSLDGRGRSMSPTGAGPRGDAKDTNRSDLV